MCTTVVESQKKVLTAVEELKGLVGEETLGCSLAITHVGKYCKYSSELLEKPLFSWELGRPSLDVYDFLFAHKLTQKTTVRKLLL